VLYALAASSTVPVSMDNLLRSLLFVPGDQPEKIKKAWQADSDCIVLDLEDGVSASRKILARQCIQEALQADHSEHPAVLVRIESDLQQRIADIETAIHPGVSGIMLPKSATRNEVVEVAREMERVERLRGIALESMRLFLLVESARGLLDLPSIVAGIDRVAAIVFGAEDWCLDMGIARTPGGGELEIARWNIALCARANGLLAIDTVYADFEDTEGLLRDAANARLLGFTGKLAIHPKQVAPIHSAFAPTDSEIAEAAAVVAAFGEAETQGHGVVAVNGRMVDKPIVERFRQILLRAEKAK
jgi:citrate lyase subunit beta / citryl-CoA lyase